MIYGLTRNNQSDIYYIYLSKDVSFGYINKYVFLVYSTDMDYEEEVILE